MLYSTADIINTKLLVSYPKTQVGFQWSNIESIKNNITYLFLDIGNTKIGKQSDYSADIEQNYSLYIIFKNEIKSDTIYSNYKDLMDIELHILELLSQIGCNSDVDIDRETTFVKKGLPFNLPLPYYASRIDFIL